MKLPLLSVAILASICVSSAQAQNSSNPGNQEQARDQTQQAPVEPRTSAEGEPAAEVVDRGEEMICRRDRVTGSLTRSNRTCMTRNEWNGVAQRTRSMASDLAPRIPGAGGCQTGVAGC